MLALQPQRAQLADVPEPRGQDLRGAPHGRRGHPQERQHGEPVAPLRGIHQRRRVPRRRARPRRRRRRLRLRRLRPGLLLRQPRAQERSAAARSVSAPLPSNRSSATARCRILDNRSSLPALTSSELFSVRLSPAYSAYFFLDACTWCSMICRCL